MMVQKRNRKIRISILSKKRYYSFCWIEFLKDGSFSLGFNSKIMNFTEYGTAVLRNGRFTEYEQTLTSGKLNIKDAKNPHITFHPPNISQKKGIVHIIASNGMVDELEVDWFPVTKPEVILYVYTGEIGKLDIDTKKRSSHEIVDVPADVTCLRMELLIYPRNPKYPKPADLMHDKYALANITGGSPDYILSCLFYKNEVVEPQMYFTT